MPIFFSLGYLAAVVAVCCVYVYTGVKGARLFVEADASPLAIVELAAVGAASLLGFALFVKLLGCGVSPYLGVAVYAMSTAAWLAATIFSPDSEIASLAMLLATFVGIVVFLFAARRPLGGKVVVTACAILTLSLLAQPMLLFISSWPARQLTAATMSLLVRPLLLLPFIGLIVSCGLLAYGIMRRGERKGSLSEMLIVVALIAIALGVSTAVRRAAHPALHGYGSDPSARQVVRAADCDRRLLLCHSLIVGFARP